MILHTAPTVGTGFALFAGPLIYISVYIYIYIYIYTDVIYIYNIFYVHYASVASYIVT